MALIVFLRGINVGGHGTFRPSMLERDLAVYDVVNVGAAGTLVVRKPVSRTKFLAELRRKLPFEAAVSFCDARDLIRLEMENPFGAEPFDQDVVRFVSILSKASRGKASLPIAFPPGEKWFVRIIGSRKRLVFGVYRHHMRTIGYLGEIDSNRTSAMASAEQSKRESRILNVPAATSALLAVEAMLKLRTKALGIM